MLNKETTACFTGYRAEKFSFSLESGQAYENLCYQVYEEITYAVDRGYRTFIYGGSSGFDILAAEQVLKYKCRAEDKIALICAVPFPQQAARWSMQWKRRYKHLLKQVDQTIMLAKAYHKGCYRKRNYFMVDHSSLVIAYHDGKSGGSKETCVYAAHKNIPIINIAKKKEDILF